MKVDQKYSVFGLGRCSLFAPQVLIQPRAAFGLILSTGMKEPRQIHLGPGIPKLCVVFSQGLSSLVSSAGAQHESLDPPAGRSDQ